MGSLAQRGFGEEAWVAEGRPVQQVPGKVVLTRKHTPLKGGAPT